MKQLALLILLTLSGCQSGQDKEVVLRQGDQDGAILVGLRSDRPSVQFSMYFAKSDNSTGISVERGAPMLGGPETNVNKYFVFKVAPGDYTLREFRQWIGRGNEIICFAYGTDKFTVTPGEVTYIGDYVYSFDQNARFKSLTRETNDAAAKAALSDFSYVSAPFRAAEPQLVGFTPTRATFLAPYAC